MNNPKPKTTFIIHGKLRNREKIKTKIETFSKHLLDINIEFTSTSGATKPTILAIKNEAEIIVICGGDGSINEIVNGYFESNTTREISFGILPMGTGNDFVKSLKTAKNIEELLELITKNSIKEVDIFKMNFLNTNQEKTSRYFINIADIGIGGFVAQKIQNSNKIFGSNFSYIIAVANSFLTYKKQKVKLSSNSFNWQGPVMSMCFANGKYFGSGMGIAPNATLTDQNLQLTVLGDVSIIDYIKNLGTVKKGKKIKHKEVFYETLKDCKVESLEKPCPIDMDGEFVGFTPLEIKIHNQKMKFFSFEN